MGLSRSRDHEKLTEEPPAEPTPQEATDGGAPSDEVLMLRHRDGDRAAFQVLFQRYARTIYAVMLKRGLSEDDARDLVQQTFLKAHQARRDFDADLKLRPWLWTIAFNLLRDGYRRRRSHQARVTALAEQAEVVGQIEQRELEPERTRAVRRAIEQLSPGQQEVVLLHWYQGLSFREIASVVGATESAVKVRAHRAYGQLRQFLSQDDEAREP
jgi:RNA polymerase sigma-70 factor (ECF subfamily)